MTTIEEKKLAVKELWVRRYSLKEIEKAICMRVEILGALGNLHKDVMLGNFKLYYFISGMEIELVE